MSRRFTIGKQERLKSRKRIEELFRERKPFVLAPFRVYMTVEAGKGNLQIGVGVSSRNFKKATDRNKIKRRMREAWRLQNEEVKDSLRSAQKDMFVFIQYSARELPDYQLVSGKMRLILQRLLKLANEDAAPLA